MKVELSTGGWPVPASVPSFLILCINLISCACISLFATGCTLTGEWLVSNPRNMARFISISQPPMLAVPILNQGVARWVSRRTDGSQGGQVMVPMRSKTHELAKPGSICTTGHPQFPGLKAENPAGRSGPHSHGASVKMHQWPPPTGCPQG